MEYKYSPTLEAFYPVEMLDAYADLPTDLMDVSEQAYDAVLHARSQGLAYRIADDGSSVSVAPSSTHDWDTKAGKWVLDKAKQAEFDAQAAQVAGLARLAEIENAIQTHINQTVANLGMGFTDDTSLIGKYAGYDNVFRPIAEAVGKWVAGIWYKAAQDKNAIIAGKKPIPTVEEAVARIPKFVMPEQSTEVQNA